MRRYIFLLQNENGSVMNVAILILMLLALIGISVSRSTTTDVKITGNYKAQTMAFYAADAARAYVIAHKELYDSDNITPDTNPGDDNGKYLPTVSLDTGTSFNGYVQYLDATNPPEGSGTETGLRAHNYLLTGNGNGPHNATCQVQVGFYRTGL